MKVRTSASDRAESGRHGQLSCVLAAPVHEVFRETAVLQALLANHRHSLEPAKSTGRSPLCQRCPGWAA